MLRRPVLRGIVSPLPLLLPPGRASRYAGAVQHHPIPRAGFFRLMDCRNFIGDVALLAGKLLAWSALGAALMTTLAFLMGW